MTDRATRNADEPTYDSHLFIVRISVHNSETGEREWHGKVQHAPSGSVRYFRDWATLVAYLDQVLADATRGASADSDAQIDGGPTR